MGQSESDCDSLGCTWLPCPECLVGCVSPEGMWTHSHMCESILNLCEEWAADGAASLLKMLNLDQDWTGIVTKGRKRRDGMEGSKVQPGRAGKSSILGMDYGKLEKQVCR